MTPRRCLACGTEEVRTIINGRASVNLEPVSGFCIACLAQASKEAKQTTAEPLPFDSRAAAARNDV